MTKIYLAARYSRHPEMQSYAADLQALGHEITSRWIWGNHQITDEALEDVEHESLRQRFALEDLDDLLDADVCISFTEVPRQGSTRGGRHVEFGIALAHHKPCYVVGHRENIFHCLPQVRFYETWHTCLADLIMDGAPK